MLKKITLLLALAALLSPSATLQAAPTEPATRHPDQLVAETLANNPELEADQACGAEQLSPTKAKSNQ